MIHCKGQNPRVGQGLKVRTATVDIGKCKKVVVRLRWAQAPGKYFVFQLIEHNPIGHDLKMCIANLGICKLLQQGDVCGFLFED
jgi:hypothetical protein